MVCTTLSTTPPRITQETRLKRGKLVLKIPGPPPGVFRAEGTIWVRRSGPGLHMRHEDLLTSQRSNAQRSIFKGSLVLNPDPLLPCILGSTFNVQRFNSPWGGIFLMYIYNNKGLTYSGNSMNANAPKRWHTIFNARFFQENVPFPTRDFNGKKKYVPFSTRGQNEQPSS